MLPNCLVSGRHDDSQVPFRVRVKSAGASITLVLWSAGQYSAADRPGTAW